MTIKLLSAKELQPSTLPQSIQFTTTAEIDDFEGVLGQSRAIEALHFSMGIGHTGYNLYVLGASGTGKHTVVDRFISELAQDKQIPNDWCYIHNFKNPQQPIALELPPGKAIKLRIDMDHLLEELIHMIPSAFETETYQKQIDDIQFKLESKQNKVLSKVKKQAEKQSMQLVRTPTGYQFSPIHEGETISDENFELLPKEIQNKYSENIEKLEKELKSKVQQFSQWQRDSRESSKSLNRQTTVTCINPLIQDLNDKWTDYTEVLQYFETIQEDVVLNVSDFLPSDDDPQTSFTNSQSASHPIFRKYKVNVITDHSESVGAPIIYEDNPSLINIIGNTEYISEYGSLTTDSLLIKPGALHKANGGYLILDADKLMMHDFSWESLKRALKTQKIRIESLEKMYSYNSTVTLDPESIPLSIKVVLIGDRELHYLFSEHDEDYCKLFRVSADFEETILLNDENLVQYIQFIATMARQHKISPIDRNAIERILKESIRWSGQTNKLSLETNKIVDLLCESNFWSQQQNKQIIDEQDIQQAINKKNRRYERPYLDTLEMINDRTILIDTASHQVGQINGLSVVSYGDYSFGQPSKITVNIKPGNGEIIDIEREVNLGGSLHSKGVLILSSYLSHKYSQQMPLSLSASIVFEQSYGEIDGDSASSAELYALLSALANIKINQCIAVTGSVNQRGQIQAIGGANEKIEGFFEVCKAHGLNGDHGVIIPKSNTQHLMLNTDVTNAIEQGLFHLYAVEHINEGIEILTGYPMGQLNKKLKYPKKTINRCVHNRLKLFKKILKKA